MASPSLGRASVAVASQPLVWLLAHGWSYIHVRLLVWFSDDTRLGSCTAARVVKESAYHKPSGSMTLSPTLAASLCVLVSPALVLTVEGTALSHYSSLRTDSPAHCLVLRLSAPSLGFSAAGATWWISLMQRKRGRAVSHNPQSPYQFLSLAGPSPVSQSSSHMAIQNLGVLPAILYAEVWNLRSQRQPAVPEWLSVSVWWVTIRTPRNVRCFQSVFHYCWPSFST